MQENYTQQMKDSDMIFKQITTGDFNSFKEAEQALLFYATDMTISRSGISHAYGRLKKHFAASEKSNN